MKTSKILVLGMLGTIFFRTAWLRAVPAFRPSLLLSKGFALLPFKKWSGYRCCRGWAVSVDGHAVPKGQQWPCRDPGTDGGVPEASRDARSFKNQILMEITVHFG